MKTLSFILVASMLLAMSCVIAKDDTKLRHINLCSPNPPGVTGCIPEPYGAPDPSRYRRP